MNNYILYPPLAFIIIFLAVLLLSKLFSRLRFHRTKPAGKQGEAYACGEDNYDHLAQPDYSIFFPYAFFFTLAHVATLIMTTVPKETLASFALAGLYILGAATGLFILLRKQD